MEKKFETVQKSVDLNFLFLEELLKVDLAVIEKTEKEFLFSQLEKTTRILLSILKKNG